MYAFKLNQAGAGHLIVVFVLLFVGIVSFGGYRIATMNKLQENSPLTSTKADSVPVSIETTADLNTTSSALDTDTELTTGLDDSKLDEDLDAML